MGVLDRLTGKEKLLDEIEKLRRENRRLRSESQPKAAMRSIVGLEDRVIQLDNRLQIVYINSPLAAELGASRDALLGRPLADVDRFPWGPGRLAELVRRAIAEEAGVEVQDERIYTDPQTGKRVFLRVKVTCHEDCPQILIEDITNLRNLEQIFARYVSPRVIEKMKRLTEKDFFVAERQELTILFADLRGFTAAAEAMVPFEVRDTINDYLEAMISVADRHEAYVDKLVGDAVMLLFGAPIPDPEHASKSLEVALDMIAAQETLGQAWARAGRPDMGVGIGINTGEVVVGNVGSSSRMAYTVIGHHVNVASRLCGHAERGEVLLTEKTYRTILEQGHAVRDRVDFTPKGEIRAKGIRDPLPVISARPRPAQV